MRDPEERLSRDPVLPRGSREKSEQARSRFELPKDLAADARNLVAGDVVAFRGLFADVRPTDAATPEETVRCAIRGRLETADSEDRALLAVGDRVEFSRAGEDEARSGRRPCPDDAARGQGIQGIIERLLPRRDFIVRGDRRVQRFRHVIAANIDGVVLVTSALEPRFRPGIVDRFLVAASSQGVAASLVINKIDLIDKRRRAASGPPDVAGPRGRAGAQSRVKSSRAEIEEYRALYEKLGLSVFLTSAVRTTRPGRVDDVVRTTRPGRVDDVVRTTRPEEGIGLEGLARHLSTGRLVLVGHSGVGKTTLLNALSPGLGLAVRPVNRKTGKGTHATSVARLLSLAGGIEVIDTPGIRELDVVDVASVDLEAHFPEFLPLLEKCEKDNCTHREEPGCAITAAVGTGEVRPRRYESYVTMRKELEERERAYD